AGTLALGMGANTMILSTIHTVLVQPHPYSEPHRIVQVWGEAPRRGVDQSPISYRRFLGIAAQSASFESIGAYTGDTINLTGAPERGQLKALRVSAGILDVLRVKAARGRNFLPEEERPGGAPVVILGDELWRQRFKSDPSIVGKSIALDGTPHTIVGVL